MNKKTYLKNTIILILAMALTKAIGALFKIPLANILGGMGMGYFSTAYGLYSPVFAVTAAGIPTIMLKMTAQSIAHNRYQNAQQQKKTALLLFALIGIVGTAVILLLAKPFAYFVASSDKCLPSLFMIAPAVFFCCVSSVIRGYYEGLSNMIPSAVSQIVEAVTRAAFGLLMSYGVVSYGLNQYEVSGTVFGSQAMTYSNAMMLILPYAAAAAVLAVTFSEFFAMLMLIIKDKYGKKSFSPLDDGVILQPKDQAKKMLMEIIPIAVSAVIMNLIGFIDLITVPICIDGAIQSNKAYFLNQFSNVLSYDIGLNELSNFMYGSYTGIAFSVFMLVPSFCMMMEKSALPIVAEAWEKKDCNELSRGLSMVLSGALYTGVPACFGLVALAEPILNLLFSSRKAELSVCMQSFIILASMGIFMIITSAVFSVFQSVGHAKIPLKIMVIGVIAKLVFNLALLPIPELNITASAISTGLSYLITAVIGVWALKKNMNCKLNIISIVSKPLFSGAVCGIAAFICKNFIFVPENDVPSIIASIAIGALFYVISLVLFEKNRIKIMIKQKKVKIIQNSLQKK